MSKRGMLLKRVAFLCCLAGSAVVTGCVSGDGRAGSSYPTYDKWWVSE